LAQISKLIISQINLYLLLSCSLLKYSNSILLKDGFLLEERVISFQEFSEATKVKVYSGNATYLPPLHKMLLETIG